jgi:hypothetical protein
MVARHFDRNGEMSIGRVKVGCFEQHHPGRSFAYSFECDGKKVVYATDNELDQTLADPGRVETHPEELRKVPEPFVKFCFGADLLIADGQYTDEEYPKKLGWGHARANTVVDLAVQAEVKQCAIFHHDPLHTDTRIDEIVREGRARLKAHGSEVSLFGAREGLELRL